MEKKVKKGSRTNKTAMSIGCVVTGFDPFPGQPFNPSGVIAQSMPDELTLPESKVKISVRNLVLPTIGNKCWQVLEPVLDKMEANNTACVLVMTGVAAKRNNINLERFALNIRDDQRPDNSNRIVENERLIDSAPEAFRTNAPIESTFADLIKKGWPAEISNYIGTYICNDVYFRTLNYFQNISNKRKMPYSVIFVHIPLPETYGKTLKAKGTKKTKSFSKGQDNQMSAIFQAVKAVAEFNCEFLIKQMQANK